MQDAHPAVRITLDNESRALSLSFRQEAYEMAVKAQRELITAGMRAAGRRLVEIMLLAMSLNRMTGRSFYRYRSKRAYSSNAA